MAEPRSRVLGTRAVPPTRSGFLRRDRGAWTARGLGRHLKALLALLATGAARQGPRQGSAGSVDRPRIPAAVPSRSRLTLGSADAPAGSAPRPRECRRGSAEGSPFLSRTLPSPVRAGGGLRSAAGTAAHRRAGVSARDTPR